MNLHLTAFTPSHTTRPALPPRGGRGIHDYTGIPQLSEPDDVPRPLFDKEFDKARADELAAVCEAIKQRMAAESGGTWSGDLR